MSHDQFFKELFQAFFQQFVELFFPDVAARLDFANVEFLDKEMFTDLPTGAVREADLVVRVRTHEGEPELILVHIEVQTRRGREFGARMSEYYMLLRLRHRLPVLPVVFYLERGAGGLGRDRYQESVFGRPVLTFDYERIGVRDLAADEYLQHENSLAPALATLMPSEVLHPAQLKAQALLRIAQALVNEAQRMLLANCVEIYLPLSESEQELFENLTRQSAYREVTEMKSVYEIRGEERGKARGERNAALFLLQKKFGALPEHVETRVQMMESQAEINALLAGILSAHSLEELNLVGDEIDDDAFNSPAAP